MALSLSQQLPDDSDRPERAAGPLIEKKSSTLEVLGAQFALDQTSGGTNALVRAAARSTLENDFIADPKELNEQYPDMAVPFDKPTSAQKAQVIFEQDQRRRELEKVIANGDQDNTLLEAGKFVTGIAAGFTDPVGMAVGMATGAGLMKVLGGSLLRGSAVTKVSQTTIAAIEGGIGNAVENLAITQPLLKQERVDAAAYDNLATTVAAGVLFPVGIGAGKKAFNFLRRGKNADLKTEKAVLLSERQMENGQRVDTEIYTRAELQKELPEIKEELEQSRLNGDEATQKELQEIVDEVEVADPLDRAAEAAKGNSEAAKLNQQEGIKEALDAGSIEEFEPLDQKFTEDFDELNTQLTELDDDFLDADSLKEIENAKAEIANVDKLDEMARAAAFCVRG